jgi:protein O-GlcNAc transferase
MDPVTVRLAALRLAPVQCTSWGHPDTSGLPTIDYFLSSELMEPPDADEHYTEKLIRLPNLSICYTPVDIAPVPMSRATFNLRHHSVLYLCCQSLFKYLPQHDEVFPRIAREVKDCQFLFISHTSNYVTEQSRSRISKVFHRFGMNPDEHIVFLPRLDMGHYYAMNRLSDIYLDSIGWSGGNTTLEAIACNLPIVTFPGSLMRSRHSAAILTMMEITDTIAATLDDYIDLAIHLGKDAELRRNISEKIEANKYKIYHDKACIHALEDFLEKVVNKF